MRATLSGLTSSAAAQRIGRFARCERGVTAIEFAFVSPILIAIVLATAQVAVIFIAQSYMETISEAGMRIVLTNQANTLTQAQFQNAICAKITALFSCSNMIIDVETAPSNATNMTSAMPQFDKTGKLVNPTNFTLTPGATMMLVVMYQWPVVGGPLGMNFSTAGIGNGTFLLVSTQIFQIEPKVNS
jgi:Flp pilus assembly protein TadG